MLLQEKNVIITGAAGGIGRALVRLFAEQGAHVWACCHKASASASEFFDGLNVLRSGSVVPLYFDLCDQTSLRDALKQILAEKREIHALVNNAGVTGAKQLFAMTPITDIRKVFDVNFFSQLDLTQMVVRHMTRNPAVPHSVISISSVAALDGEPGQIGYVASKSALLGMTRKLARELAVTGIRVNAIAPGITDTAMIGAMSDELKEKTIALSVGKKVGKPDDVAGVAAWLASDLSCGVTGEIIRVNS